MPCLPPSLAKSSQNGCSPVNYNKNFGCKKLVSRISDSENHTILHLTQYQQTGRFGTAELHFA